MRLPTETVPIRTTGIISPWFRAVRFQYVPPSYLPAILCSIMAWAKYGLFDPFAFLLVVTGVVINHFGLNMIDDVFDYLHFVDKSSFGEINPFTGGSRVIPDGLLTARQVLAGAMICFSITFIIGLYLTFLKGWPVFAIGIFGLFCSVFYTVPPIKFGYRGLGEMGLLVNFGPVIGAGSYYVQAGRVDPEPFVISFVLGFMMWSMITINEIPDYEADWSAGKMNLVARFGRKAGVVLYAGGLFCAYLVLLSSVLSGLAPPVAALGFLSFPLAVKSLIVLKRNYHDNLLMAPANLAMIKIHFMTGLALIIAYLLHGLAAG